MVTADILKNDIYLRPYFFDFIAMNYQYHLVEEFGLSPIEQAKVRKKYYESLYNLLESLGPHLQNSEIYHILYEAIEMYASKGVIVTHELFPRGKEV